MTDKLYTEAELQEAVRDALQVKPLVWELDSEYWWAETPFGDVSVYYDVAYGWVFDDDEISPNFLKYPSSFVGDSGYESAEDVKESVEAQIAQRVLSALKGGPHD